MIILPLLVFTTVFLIVDANGASKRESFLKASLIWAVILNILTEILSYFYKFNFNGVATAWGTIFVISLFFLKYSRLVRLSFPRDISWVWVFYIGTFLIATGVIAIVAPPNTWDSMTYHMPRVEHWIFNNTVAAYPTAVTRQIWLNPWAEYAITHFQILIHNSDRMANMVQWFSYLGCVIGASLVTKMLEGNNLAQLFSALLVAVTPMVILQGSSTQNDLVCAFFIIAAVYFSIKLMKSSTNWDPIYLSAAVALSIATKGTAFIYLPPFLVWLGLALLGKKDFKKIGLLVTSGFLLVIAINGSHWLQNYRIWGNPLGPSQTLSMLNNQEHSLRVLVSNLLRNISLHLHIPVESFKTVLGHGLAWVHSSILHLDISSPLTTFVKNFNLGYPIAHEDYAGNPVQLILFVFALFVLFKKKTIQGGVQKLSICILAAALLFSYLLKWQPWNSRLHTSLFVLISIPVAMAISEKMSSKWRYLAPALFLSGLPWLLLGDARPLISMPSRNLVSIFTSSRIDQYFTNWHPGEESYVEAVENLGKITQKFHCSNIGLKLVGEGWEYPFWMIAQAKGFKMNFTHLDIPEEFKVLTHEKSPICAYVVASETAESPPRRPEDQSLQKMKLVWSSPLVQVYGP